MSYMYVQQKNVKAKEQGTVLREARNCSPVLNGITVDLKHTWTAFLLPQSRHSAAPALLYEQSSFLTEQAYCTPCCVKIKLTDP